MVTHMTRDLFGRVERADELFRARVAGHLAPEWVTRANALKVCGSAGVKLRCSCGCAQLVPYACGSRACPSCARTLAAIKTARVANRVAVAQKSRWTDDLWDGKGKPRRIGWKMFTGTSRAAAPSKRYESDVLSERIQRVRKAWGPFWRSTAWGARVRLDRVDSDGVVIGANRRARRDTAAVVGIEVAPGGMVHCHAAIRGEWIEAAELQTLWSRALGEPAFVKIKAMRATTPDDFQKALREVLKYVTKWDKSRAGLREQRAAVIEAAMRGVRRVEMIGAIRAMPGVDATVERPNPEACSSCGEARAWRWSGVWSPDEVKANGGFGPVTALIDDAERRKWRKDPARAFIERERLANDDLINELASSESFDSTDADADSSALFHGE